MLKDKFQNIQFLLASQSPRRQELLKGLGIDFEIVKVSSDETYPSTLQREKITEHISKNKTKAFSGLKKNQILITADTLVWLEGQILEKPKDAKDAFQMIRNLSGKTHQVYTSVTITAITKSITFSDKTDVAFDEFSDEEISFYIENFKPFDKAGAYGIQDWLGYAKIKGINGCYYNVMGLPLQKLYKVLTSEF